MVYLEFSTHNNQVIEIHDIEPGLSEGYLLAKTDEFKVGDEFELTIWVNEVDEEGFVKSYSAIRNNPNANRLLGENVELKKSIGFVESENADLWFENLVQQSKTEIHEKELADLWYIQLTGGVM